MYSTANTSTQQVKVNKQEKITLVQLKETEQNIRHKLISLYSEMSKLTEPECRLICKSPHSCCSDLYCSITEEWALSNWNVKLEHTQHPTLRFMTEKGCSVKPHLRPFCTLHTCEVNAISQKRDDPDNKWTTRYFELRDVITMLEETLNDYINKIKIEESYAIVHINAD